MRSNPIFDPVVEAGYLGYSLRAAAHRQPDKTYRPSLEIRDYRYGAGELLYECALKEVFFDCDEAIDSAMGKGRQVIENLLELMNLEERVGI